MPEYMVRRSSVGPRQLSNLIDDKNWSTVNEKTMMQVELIDTFWQSNVSKPLFSTAQDRTKLETFNVTKKNSDNLIIQKRPRAVKKFPLNSQTR